MERGCCCHRTPDLRALDAAPLALPTLCPISPRRARDTHMRVPLREPAPPLPLPRPDLALALDGLCARAARAARAALAARRPKTPRGTRWSRAAVDAPRMTPAPARSHCSHCSRTAPSRTLPRALPV
jgi:hypothetical protein